MVPSRWTTAPSSITSASVRLWILQMMYLPRISDRAMGYSSHSGPCSCLLAGRGPQQGFEGPSKIDYCAPDALSWGRQGNLILPRGHRAQETYTSFCRSTYLAISEVCSSVMISMPRSTQTTGCLYGLQNGSLTPAVSCVQ